MGRVDCGEDCTYITLVWRSTVPGSTIAFGQCRVWPATGALVFGHCGGGVCAIRRNESPVFGRWTGVGREEDRHHSMSVTFDLHSWPLPPLSWDDCRWVSSADRLLMIPLYSSPRWIAGPPDRQKTADLSSRGMMDSCWWWSLLIRLVKVPHDLQFADGNLLNGRWQISPPNRWMIAHGPV